MTIKTELIKGGICDAVCSKLTDFDIDESKVADTRAIQALGEIRKILNDEDLSEFEMVDSIVSVFGKYNLSFSDSYDF